MFFSIVGDFSEIGFSATGVPMLQLFYQALNHRAGAIVLEALIIATLVGCMVACHTYQSRLCWSFARDRGLPAHNWLSKVHKDLDVPLNAHFTSCSIVAILGCMYLASLTAFNSYVDANTLEPLADILQNDHRVHSSSIPELCYPSHLPTRSRPLQHQARPILARTRRSLCKCRSTSLDALHAGHVLISLR